MKNPVNPAFVFDPLRRISDPPELNFGLPCFFIEGVPSQPNSPSAGVPYTGKT